MGDSKVASAGAEWKQILSPRGEYYFYNEAKDIITWDRPGELKAPSGEFKEHEGEWYWVPSSKEGYTPGKLVKKQKSGNWELETENGQSLTVSKKKLPLERLYWSHLKRVVQDLVMLDVLNRPLICYNLMERYKSNQIYTSIGSILISLNPYKWLPLYTPEVISRYQKKRDSQPPHVFGIASDAFLNLWENVEGQSIVISGESGAGKTECTKQCLAYLAEVACSAESNIEQKILSANPILEAFGNAKTVRNNNSSRFGKYVEVFFDRRRTICGARTTNYLLERSRVCFQAPEERNFHVFFQLCSSSPEERKKLFLGNGNTADFGYLREGAQKVDGIDDTREYKDMLQAFKKLSFTTEEVDDVLKTAAGVLNLGNCEFVASKQTTHPEPCSFQDEGSVAAVSSLLSLPEKALRKGLLFRTFKSRGAEDVDIPLKANEARATRDAMAKFVYGKLFDWLVLKINLQLDTEEKKGNEAFAKTSNGRRLSIGILDIFGFEIFQENSFEQLCINYANEKLQQLFNSWTFKKEQALYKEEGISYEEIKFIDNQKVLDLIEKKKSGIMAMIDEEIRMPKGSDVTLMLKLMRKHAKHPALKKNLKVPSNFILKHYAGNVEYLSGGFIEKSKDRLTDDLAELLSQTTSDFLNYTVFTVDAPTGMSPDGSPLNKPNSLPPRGRTRAPTLNLPAAASDRMRSRSQSLVGKRSSQTIGGKFKRQLSELMTTLNSTEPHYIRCVKPNSQKAALVFNGEMVLEQLQYSGVFEAVQIRKQGYPFRYKHLDFWRRYRCVFGLKHQWGQDLKANVKAILKRFKMDDGSIQFGKTRVLYRATQHRIIELRRNLAVDGAIRFIQRVYRGYRARKLKNDLLRVRPSLRQAITDRTLEAVNPALAVCDTLEFPIVEISKLKALKKLLLEEKRIREALETLLTKDPEKVDGEIGGLLEDAKAIAYVTDLTKKSLIFTEDAKKRRASRLEIASALDKRGVRSLGEAISTAEALIASPAPPALVIYAPGKPFEDAKQLFKILTQELKIASSILAALTTPMAKPPAPPPPGAEDNVIEISNAVAFGVMSKAQIDNQALSALIKTASETKSVTLEKEFASSLAIVTNNLRECFVNAFKTEDINGDIDKEWASLTEAITKAEAKTSKRWEAQEGLPMAGEQQEWIQKFGDAIKGIKSEIRSSKVATAHASAVKRCGDGLLIAIDKRQRTPLGKYLDSAIRLGLSPSPESGKRGGEGEKKRWGEVVEKAKKLAESIDTCVKRLVEATETRVEKNISERLSEITDLKIDEDQCLEVVQAKDILKRMKICCSELKKATAEIYEDHGKEQMEKWISETVTLRFEPQPELQAARAAMEALEKDTKLAAAIDTETESGGLLKDSDNVETKALLEAIKALTTFHPRTTRSKLAVARGEAIIRVRDAIKTAHGTKDKALWKAVDGVLASMPPNLANHPEVEFAGNLLASQRGREEISEKLKQAINERDKSRLTQFLKRAKELDMHDKHLHQHPEYPEGEKLLGEIIACTNALLDHTETRNQQGLEAELKKAEDLKLPENMYVVIPESKAFLQKLIDMRNQLQTTTDNIFEEEGRLPLEQAIQATKAFKFENAPEFDQACFCLKRRMGEDDIRKDLTNTCNTGGYVEHGAEIDSNIIQTTVDRANEHKMDTKEGQNLLDLASHLLMIRLALIPALQSREEKLWNDVSARVTAANNSGWDSHPEVNFAEERVEFHRTLETASHNAREACMLRNPPLLVEWISQLKTLGLSTDHKGIKHELYTELPEAEDMLARLERVRNLIKEAENTRTVELFEQAVARGQELSLGIEGRGDGTRLLQAFQDASQMRDLIGQIALEAEDAVRLLENKHMANVLERARQFQFKNKDIDQLEALLEQTPEQKLMQMQLRVCSKEKDFGRLSMIEIKLNAWYLQNHKAMFRLELFPALKQKSGWAKQKLVCFNRQKLAESFFYWQQNTIHASMTNLSNKKDNTEAGKIFKSILGFMGDKALPAPLILAQELLQKCLDNPQLIDEVYVQLIKQLSGNPDKTSEDKGWDLMAIMLEVLKPRGVQKYLESWLTDKAGARLERLQTLLHQTMYETDMKNIYKSAPSESVIENIIKGYSSKDLKKILEPKPYTPPTYNPRPWEEVVKDLKEDLQPISVPAGGGIPGDEKDGGQGESEIEESLNEWEAVESENGIYYWNTRTDETRWDPPEGFDPVQ